MLSWIFFVCFRCARGESKFSMQKVPQLMVLKLHRKLTNISKCYNLIVSKGSLILTILKVSINRNTMSFLLKLSIPNCCMDKRSYDWYIPFDIFSEYKNIFALVTKELNKDIALYAFMIVEEDINKDKFLNDLSRHIANSTCRADYENLLESSDASSLLIDTSDLHNKTLSKAASK